VQPYKYDGGSKIGKFDENKNAAEKMCASRYPPEKHYLITEVSTQLL